MEKLGGIMNELRQEYGVPSRRGREPLEGLVQVILSQNTNDRNRDRAWKRIQEKFGDLEKLKDAEVGEIADAISVAGLQNTKAERIKKALEKIEGENGELSLEFLEDMELDEARDWLLELPGIGPKSAAVILNFSFGKEAFPVDTHVLRVSKRLGLVPEGTSREKAHELLEDMVPGERMHEFHINLIRHGRKICKARNPACEICTLSELCDYYEENG
ncbi:MAG: endonuclease III domain-containing protein [Candidatus Aenigmatarchaeota archaeon]